MKKPCNGCECANIGYNTSRAYHYCTDPIREAYCEYFKKYKKYLESRRKYERGEPIESLELLQQQTIVFIFGKPRHIGFALSLQFRMLSDMVKQGKVFYAIRKEESHE